MVVYICLTFTEISRSKTVDNNAFIATAALETLVDNQIPKCFFIRVKQSYAEYFWGLSEFADRININIFFKAVQLSKQEVYYHIITHHPFPFPSFQHTSTSTYKTLTLAKGSRSSLVKVWIAQRQPLHPAGIHFISTRVTECMAVMGKRYGRLRSHQCTNIWCPDSVCSPLARPAASPLSQCVTGS